MQNCLSSNAEKKRFSIDSKSVHSFSSNRKRMMPGTAARCWYHTSGFRFTDPSYYLEKVFLEGLMSSCRSRRESHNCSELSYRILKWSASNVQKTPTKQSDTMKMNLSLSKNYIYPCKTTGDVDDIKQQRYTMCPPSCDLSAPRGGTI